MKQSNQCYKSDRNYEDWFLVKDNIQYRKTLRSFKEWEMWWCAIGENVGVEINGKGKKFIRPVIIFKKFGKLSFVGIPSTTQNHLARSPDWYVHFRFRNVDEYAAINQLETISVFRLYRKMGELDDEDIQKIRNGLWNLYGTKNAPSTRRGRAGKSRRYFDFNSFRLKMQHVLRRSMVRNAC